MFDTASVTRVYEKLRQSSNAPTFFIPGLGFDLEAILEYYVDYGKKLSDLIDDTDAIVRGKRADGKSRILLEGAQGELLSIDSGTYPYVTSSDCSVSGLAKGVGLKERDVDLTVAVAKGPYMTRVGAGPFPTELGGADSADRCNTAGTDRDTERERYPEASVNSADEYEQGVAIRQAGDEYGSTTGRPRRTGWLDTTLLRHTVRRASGQVALALTKADVLDKCERIRLCNGYTYTGPDFRFGSRTLRTGDKISEAIVTTEVLKHSQPIYDDYPGWMSPTHGLTKPDEVPDNLRTIIGAIEENTGARVRILSVGPDRDQTILLD